MSKRSWKKQDAGRIWHRAWFWSMENEGRGKPQGRGGRIEVNGREKAVDFDGNTLVWGWAKSKEIK